MSYKTVHYLDPKVSFPAALNMEFAIDQVPWPEYLAKVRVQLALAWDAQHLFLHWQVEDPTLLARCTRDNEPVYQDSCVEFFVQFPGSADYFNIECNAIGTVLVGRGPDRKRRKLLDSALLKAIERQPSLGRTAIVDELPGPHHWQLGLIIPVTLFSPPLKNFAAGMHFKANFYKCGDHLTQPHYQCWSAIEAPKPDFHRPEFFGDLQLVYN